MQRSEFLRRCAAAAVTGVLALVVAGCAETGEPKGEPDESPVAAKAESKPDKQKPVVKHSRVEKRESIPFASQAEKTAELKKGVRQVQQAGRAGVRLKVWRVTTKDGTTTARKLVRTVVVRKPVPRIVLIGTYVAPPPPKPTCDSNYSGSCVPIASDVDCGGGSGNGPAYVYGSVRVVGSDIYDLDADGDGWGCD